MQLFITCLLYPKDIDFHCRSERYFPQNKKSKHQQEQRLQRENTIQSGNRLGWGGGGRKYDCYKKRRLTLTLWVCRVEDKYKSRDLDRRGGERQCSKNNDCR